MHIQKCEYNNRNDIEQQYNSKPWQYSEEQEAWDRVAESLRPTIRSK